MSDPSIIRVQCMTSDSIPIAIEAMGFLRPCFSFFTSSLLFLLLLSTSLAQITSVSAATYTPLPPNGYGSTGPGPGDVNDDDDNDHGVSHYYYLLIAVFVVIAIVSAWVFIRRHRMIAERMREYRSGPPGGPSGGRRGANSRWRMLGLEPRIEEGLNEQGEAPPPYMPGQAPPPVQTNGNSDAGENLIPLQTFPGKPPDYHASSSEEDLDLARPARDQAAISTATLSEAHGTTHDDASSKEVDTPSSNGTPPHESEAPPAPATTTTVSSTGAPEGPATMAMKETHG